MTAVPENSLAPSKYPPTPDPRWTPNIEAEFFARLDERCPNKANGRRGSRTPIPLTTLKANLLREYATDTLNAQRLSGTYLTTLSAVLGKFAGAEQGRTECIISQRDDRLGTPRTVRTIQGQLQAAGVLMRATRVQGCGFVGVVFIYRPGSDCAPRGCPGEELERAYRAGEGEADFLYGHVSVEAEAVPY